MDANLIIANSIQELSSDEDHSIFFTSKRNDSPMPEIAELSKAVNLLNKILFPGYYGESSINPGNLNYYVGTYIDRLRAIFEEQIKRGICFNCDTNGKMEGYEQKAKEKTLEFIERLPEIKRLLRNDVEATFLGDPASQNRGEIIYCYPGIKALTNYRIAHELIKLNVPLIPRIISEMAHSKTGIDIHPGAQIGEFFAIDHGTGIVIGETCRIGNNVKIYQGVTLGAKSFPLDEDGNPIKGIARHPVVEDNVVIYSGATVLGRVTIGENSMIGGNVWLTHGVPANSKIIQRKARGNSFSDGAGI